MADEQFIQARWFTPVARRAIDLVVIHDMEYPENLDAAEKVARFFQGLPATNKASAHHCVDADSRVLCVQEHDVAYHAPGANHNGIGIEHAGYARQTAAEWADPYSEQMLLNSAGLTADICRRYGLPHAYVDAGGLQKGYRGITTHWEVTKAFKQSDHTDPGPNFPMAHYLDLVLAAAAPAPIPQEVRPVVNAPVVAILTHTDWNGGYIEIGADGGVFSEGAPNFGSAGGTKLNSPISGAAVHPGGRGYWMVAQDGGVFSFGDAGFHGSMGGKPLNKPITGMAASPTGNGYVLCAYDGGVFPFGDMQYKGSVEYRG